MQTLRFYLVGQNCTLTATHTNLQNIHQTRPHHIPHINKSASTQHCSSYPLIHLHTKRTSPHTVLLFFCTHSLDQSDDLIKTRILLNTNTRKVWKFEVDEETSTKVLIVTSLKVLVPIHSLIPPIFSNMWRFWYQKLSHIQKALCVKFYAQSRCSLGEISENPAWKLENVVSTIYKTISNINIVFSNCLQMRYINLKCFHHG